MGIAMNWGLFVAVQRENVFSFMNVTINFEWSFYEDSDENPQ